MTKLLYLEDWNILSNKAQVTQVAQYKEKLALVLDQTIFYPQGGGQPWDTGTITVLNAGGIGQGPTGSFAVTEVRFDPETGNVYHIGTMTGEIKPGETVSCNVNKERRDLNSRLHSGGHIIDMAVRQLGLDWKPGKGYHFPEGPYIEYAGVLDESAKENLRTEIERISNEIINQKIPVTIKFIADQLVNGKPARVVMYGEHSVPCGGTHVNNLSEVGTVNIRKIKQEKGAIRVGYDVSR